MKFWYTDSGLKWLFWPLHRVTAFESRRRRQQLKKGVEQSKVPVIIVGNLTVGGTGKTPVVIALVKYFQSLGLEVGVVSRGYGSQSKDFPLEVDAKTPAKIAGDEPKLIQNATDCRVVIAPERNKALDMITTQNDFLKPVDIVIADDGLQHYGLPRWKEIVVIDAQRKFGNGLCLPAGPLREPVDRLTSVDYIIESGTSKQAYLTQDCADISCFSVSPVISSAINLKTHQQKALRDFSAEKVAAVAAIGQPDKFFDALKQQGISCEKYPFADHHQFVESDIPDKLVLMTEKDAVKCEPFATENMWFVPLEIDLPHRLLSDLREQLQHDYPAILVG